MDSAIHAHSHSHHKKKHRKKHHHHKEESESEGSEDEKEDQKQKGSSTMVQQASESDQITEKAATGLKQLSAEDASLSDMYTFSKVIANGKTANEALKEEQEKLAKMQAIAQKENEQRQE